MTNSKTKRNKKNGSTSAPSSANREIARLTKLVNESLIQDRKIRLSPLGKMAFDGGNAISSFFGGGKIFGSGAYKLSGGNTSWNTAQQVPMMHSSSDVVTLRHREYICDIDSSAAFTIQRTIAVNPGVGGSFPFLSSIASNFSEYKFKGLVFEFKSSSADALNSTNTALGTVMMSAQYRADSAPPTNKVVMLNEMWSTDGKPSENQFLPVECAPKESPLSVQYIRSGPVATTQDAKFYDLATVYVATNGSQATATVGELWCTYDVELYKPVMAENAGPMASNSYAYAAELCTTTLPLGVQVRSADYGIGCSVSHPSANTGRLTFPTMSVGQRIFVSFMYSSGTSSTISALNSTGFTAITSWVYSGTAPTSDSFNAGAGTTTQVLSRYYEVTDDLPYLELTNTISGSTTVDIMVIQVDEDQL